MVIVAPLTAAPEGSLTLPTIRPVVVWESAEIEVAHIRQTAPKTRMPFDGERIAASVFFRKTTSNRSSELFQKQN
jgi:nicotinamide mononucleotide adenylyltransferase